MQKVGQVEEIQVSCAKGGVVTVLLKSCQDPWLSPEGWVDGSEYNDDGNEVEGKYAGYTVDNGF